MPWECFQWQPHWYTCRQTDGHDEGNRFFPRHAHSIITNSVSLLCYVLWWCVNVYCTVLSVCKCVLYYCHRQATHLQLTTVSSCLYNKRTETAQQNGGTNVPTWVWELDVNKQHGRRTETVEMKLWRAAAGYSVWTKNRWRENRRSEYAMQITELRSADTVDTCSTLSVHAVNRSDMWQYSHYFIQTLQVAAWQLQNA